MITTKCSTNCCYCYAKRKFDYELTLSEITNIIEECKKFGVVNLNLTGGDIFARTNWREILYAARKCNYNPFISTKTPIREEDVHYLNTLGITEMQFSLDSCDKSVLKGLIGVQSNYIEKVAEMFQFCQKYNIKLCIRTVLCNQNADISYVSGLYGFISKYNCIKDWVLTPAFFSEFKATYRFYEVTNSQLIAVRNFVERIHSIFPVYLSKISSCGYKLKQYQTINDYVLYNQKCFANSYSMSILASGECTICEMLYNNKEYLLGNIRHQSLLDIWNGEKALRLYAPIQSEMPKTSPCHSCSVFENCRRKLSKRVCYVDIAKINKSHSLGKPDPRCPKAQDIDVVL
jgi:radical SAM protein with 4Fe4S-binding SPASM domain